MVPVPPALRASPPIVVACAASAVTFVVMMMGRAEVEAGRPARHFRNPGQVDEDGEFRPAPATGDRVGFVDVPPERVAHPVPVHSEVRVARDGTVALPTTTIIGTPHRPHRRRCHHRLLDGRKDLIRPVPIPDPFKDPMRQLGCVCMLQAVTLPVGDILGGRMGRVLEEPVAVAVVAAGAALVVAAASAGRSSLAEIDPSLALPGGEKVREDPDVASGRAELTKARRSRRFQFRFRFRFRWG